MSRLLVKFLSGTLLISLAIACKQRSHSDLLDAVDTSNSLFGTGRSVATQAAKRNCFKRDVFREGPAAAPTPNDSESTPKLTTESSRLNSTRINQMNIQTNLISTSSLTRNSRDVVVDAGINIQEGILKTLKFSPDFTVKVKDVLKENRKSNIDSYILTVKYLSHAVSIQPDEDDFKSDVLTLLDGKEDNFKKFTAACGDEFLSMKEYGGEISLVFGANTSTKTSSSTSEIGGTIKINGPVGVSAHVDPTINNKTNLIGVDKISNFVVSENILNRSGSVACNVARTASDGTSASVTYDRPFMPRNKTELDEFIFCLPRWIDAVPVSFNYTDYSTALPLALDQKVVDSYQENYVSAKKARSERLLAEHQALLAQIEREQKQQETAAAGINLSAKKTFEVPRLSGGKNPSGYRPVGQNRQTRLDLIKKHIRENQVFATPAECAIAGCSGYNESAGACTRCMEPVQGLGIGGVNFCRDDTDCREGLTCQAAIDDKTGLCR